MIRAQMSGASPDRLLAPEATDQWLWIVVVGALGAFFAAFGVGANDVANSFATSVGARALTLKQAVVLASAFEVLGAVFLGTFAYADADDIGDVKCFDDNPGILIYGMMCVLYTVGAWLLIASYLELPVSSGHSLIGAVIGMGMAYGGAHCSIVWYEDSESFPYIKGVAAIVLSWFLSPVLAGAVSVLLFLTARTFILRSSHAFDRSFWVFPVLVMVTVAVNVFYFLYKGAPSLDLDETSFPVALAVALGSGVGLALILVRTAIPAIRRNVERLYNEDGTKKAKPLSTRQLSVGPGPEELEDPQLSAGLRLKEPPEDGRCGSSFVCRQLDRDILAIAEDDEEIANIHANAEKFDPRAEEVFKYVQVVTAICDALAHGANDINNAVGPFQVMYKVYVTGGIKPLDSPLGLGSGFLIRTLGGVGMVLGMAMYGYKVITAIGVKIAKITPSRGFSIELGAATVILIGVRLEFPLSSSHCQVGATAGVALCEGTDGLNKGVMVRVIVGWAATTIFCGLFCALIFAQGAYAPFAYDTVDHMTLLQT